jgi:MATE family multidrug resistance protein
MPLLRPDKFHVRETLSLAWPVVLTQVGHVLTSLVDIIFLGRLGKDELAAGVLSNTLYVLVLVFCIGMSYAVTPLVAEAKGEGKASRMAALFKNAMLLNFVVAIGCFIILSLLSPLMQYMQQPTEVVKKAIPFFEILIFSMIPVSFFFTGKQFCEGVSNTKIALLISISGNIINVILNYVLIWGKLGFPEMGYLGSAWASFISRVFMGVVFMLVLLKSNRIPEIKALFKTARVNKWDMSRLWKIGLNSALQFTFEVAAFAIAGIMCGTFSKEHLDGHGIALNLASFTYMFASGISSAATIRAAVYYSAKDWKGLRTAGNTAIALALTIMGLFGLLFMIFRKILPAFFTEDLAIIDIASDLLIIAALFQIFDGLQVTIIGLLRGIQDVKYPTYVTLIGYWLVALPLAAILAYNFQLASIGVWIALLVSLIFVGLALFLRYNWLMRKFANFNPD